MSEQVIKTDDLDFASFVLSKGGRCRAVTSIKKTRAEFELTRPEPKYLTKEFYRNDEVYKWIKARKFLKDRSFYAYRKLQEQIKILEEQNRISHLAPSIQFTEEQKEKLQLRVEWKLMWWERIGIFFSNLYKKLFK